MRPREVHPAAELLAGTPLAWSTVKNCLAATAIGSAPRFERLARGGLVAPELTAPRGSRRRLESRFGRLQQGQGGSLPLAGAVASRVCYNAMEVRFN